MSFTAYSMDLIFFGLLLCKKSMVHTTAILVFLAVFMVSKFIGYSALAMTAKKSCEDVELNSKTSDLGDKIQAKTENVRKIRTILGWSGVGGGVVIGGALLVYLFLRQGGEQKVIQALALATVLVGIVCALTYNIGVSAIYFKTTEDGVRSCNGLQANDMLQGAMSYSHQALCGDGSYEEHDASCPHHHMRRREWIVILSLWASQAWPRPRPRFGLR